MGLDYDRDSRESIWTRIKRCFQRPKYSSQESLKRLDNTIITQLQRAQEAQLKAKDQTIAELQSENKLLKIENETLPDPSAIINELEQAKETIAALTSRAAELEAALLRANADWSLECAKLSERNTELEAQLAHRHIVGKVYDVTAESINRLAGELDELKSSHEQLQTYMTAYALTAPTDLFKDVHISKENAAVVRELSSAHGQYTHKNKD